MNSIRKERVAGMFYHADSKILAEDIEDYFKELVDIDFLKIKGLIVPHAGYVFSGRTAAYVYNLIKKHDYQRIFIIGPSHNGGEKKFYLPVFDQYRTPFGLIDVDKEIVGELSKINVFDKNELLEIEEHSIEVQLPFLKKTVPNFKIIPILFAQQNHENAVVLYEHLKKYIDSKTLVIISTDLSHYHSYNVAKEMDKLLIDKLVDIDIKGLQQIIFDGKAEACGLGGLYFAMEFAKARNLNIIPFKYTNSGTVNGDFSEVVGYFSGVIGES